MSVPVDAKADGFPFGLDRLPAGDYTVQAVLIPYTRAKRADGHIIWVPTSDQRVIAPMFPGNPYSKPVNVRLDPAAGAPVALTLTEKIAPIAREPDTPWRSEEHTSELQSLMRISYAVFCLKKKKTPHTKQTITKAHNTHNNR